ncbi:MAG: TIGR02099 family protein [Polaromonas sp.]|nr:TIGR02099 family protein [Polaromonas sp.]
MPPEPVTPPRALKWASALLRVALWTVVGAWLLFGLTWGVIHGIIVPRIGNWRVELETLATRAVGIPVRIGSIQAHTHGLVPSFELTQVRLLDAQGRDALVLGRVLTAVSVPSLWRLGFEQIHIDQPELDVRRRTDGRLEVAGLDLFSGATTQAEPNQALDWLFSQTELVIRRGQLHWTDDLRQQARVTLNDVDVVVRNPGRQHLMRLDATPVGGLAERFSLRAEMRSPFLSLHPGRWTDWQGTAYAELPGVNLARVASPARLAELMGLTVGSGLGALRLWVDIRNGQLDGATTDLALTQVHAQFAQAPQPLTLNVLDGRVGLQRKGLGWEVSTGPLTLETRSGQRWPQGKLRLLYHPQDGQAERPGELDADHISLAALYELGSGLPLPSGLQHTLSEWQPSGSVPSLKLSWVGNEAGWSRFQAKGKVENLTLAAGTPPPHPTGLLGEHPHPVPARPGVSGATVDFDMTQQGGKAQVSLTQGHLGFPGVFEEPTIPMDKLSAELRWQQDGEALQAQFHNVRFANADLQGQASGSWHTSDPATSSGKSRFPGVLQLNGQLTRGKGERVHRYLPLVIAHPARAYVKESILSGHTKDVRFHVAGDLWDMPFKDNHRGEFRIAAKVSQVDYAFVPPSLMTPDRPKWPVLKQAEGELVFEGASMALSVTKAGVADAAGLKVTRAKARIADMSSHAVVEVDASLEGPLTDALGVVSRSPLADMTGGALRWAKGSGSANVQFGLTVPLAQVDKTTVKGQVVLTGNDIQITPDTPLLGRARGRIDFSDQGFQVTQASARLLGGELQFSGGMRAKDGSGMQFRGQGIATADGLRQASYLGVAAAMASQASGSASYAAQLNVVGGVPELAIQSNLQGLGLDLPAPLNKPADAAWPLRYSNQLRPTPVGPSTDVTSFTLSSPQSPLLSITLHHEQGNQPLRRGLVQVGTAAALTPALPAKGLAVHVAWPSLNADAWQNTLTRMAAEPMPAQHPGTTTDLGELVPLPDRVVLETPSLMAMGKHLHDVNLDANRHGDRWVGRVQAQELAGQLSYQPATTRQSAHVVARLDRLTLNASHEPPPVASPPVADVQPQALPSLDVQVKALELDHVALGQLDLQATNRQTDNGPREWRLTQLSLRVPEAQLSATGNWAAVGAQSGRTPGARRTALQFKLEVEDAGALLTRFGMPGVFRGGKGLLDGTLGWLGAPHDLHTPSLSGQVKLDLAAGQFLKADPGLAKLLGVLSLQSLPRRLALDFRDVFTQGFAFDFVRGDARIDQGVMFTNNLQMKGPNAAVLMEGQADIQHETQDIRALVVPEINAGTASLIATVINPAVGLGTFLAQAVLRQPIIQASTQTFRIHGTWADPLVEKIPAQSTSAPPTTPP